MTKHASYILIVLLIVSIVCTSLSCQSRSNLAREYVVIAWNLNDPGLEITQELREELGIPDHLTTRHEVVEHYLELAVQADAKHSAAYYNMGLYFLDKDCEKAKECFRKNLLLWPNEEDSTALLQVIEKEGCAGGRLFLADMDPEERQRFLAEHPGFASEFEGSTSN